MAHLSPPTLTADETRAILRATAAHPRDHLIYSLALGTGLRLVEIVDLNVWDPYSADGSLRVARGFACNELTKCWRGRGMIC